MTKSPMTLISNSTTAPRRIALLGATGSIGQSALDVIQALPHKLQAFGLSVHRSVDQLDHLIKLHQPKIIALTSEIPTSPRTESVGHTAPKPHYCRNTTA